MYLWEKSVEELVDVLVVERTPLVQEDRVNVLKTRAGGEQHVDVLSPVDLLCVVDVDPELGEVGQVKGHPL